MFRVFSTPRASLKLAGGHFTEAGRRFTEAGFGTSVKSLFRLSLRHLQVGSEVGLLAFLLGRGAQLFSCKMVSTSFPGGSGTE